MPSKDSKRPLLPPETAGTVLRQNRAYRAIIGTGRFLVVGWGLIAFLWLKHNASAGPWAWLVAAVVTAGYVLLLVALSGALAGLLSDGRSLLAAYRCGTGQNYARWRFFHQVFTDFTDPHFFRTPRFF